MANQDDSDDLGLAAAYAVSTPDDSRQLYARWAASYDDDFVDRNGYVYHLNVVEAFLADGGGPRGPILDVGCGTGVVGQAIRARGDQVIDGIDISPEMLARAAAKRTEDGQPIYRKLIEADLTTTLDLPTDHYHGVISTGTFTHGHLGPEPLAELIRIAAAGARFAIGVNGEHWRALAFDRWFEARVVEGLITEPTFHQVVVYEAMEGEHGDDRAMVARFTVR
ncbi:MAG: class I SAM-dependent methyltransferase [Actinomycetota bacterium]